MSVDIERLKWDAAYWDEVAPDGTTHYDADDGVPECWVIRENEKWLHYSVDGEWHYWYPNSSRRIIPRPKPQSSEWDGEGLPPVGCECEVMLASNEWEWCEVKAHRGSGSWIVTRTDDRVIRNDIVKWRLIRTQAEREREELREDLDGILPFCEYDEGQIKELSEILYAQGYRKPEAK